MTDLFADPNTEVELRKSTVASCAFFSLSPPIGERNFNYFEEERICFP